MELLAELTLYSAWSKFEAVLKNKEKVGVQIFNTAKNIELAFSELDQYLMNEKKSSQRSWSQRVRCISIGQSTSKLLHGYIAFDTATHRQ